MVCKFSKVNSNETPQKQNNKYEFLWRTCITIFLFSDCNCDSNGSLGKKCDESGKCKCRKGFAGDTCNKCLDEKLTYPNCCEGILLSGCNLYRTSEVNY